MEYFIPKHVLDDFYLDRSYFYDALSDYKINLLDYWRILFMEVSRKVYLNIGMVEPKNLVSTTVVFANCCTLDIIAHLTAAVVFTEEERTLERFKIAANKYHNDLIF